MSLKFKNYHVNVMAELLNIPLHGYQARKTTQFLKLLTSQAQILEEERNKMLLEVCEKDEKGEPILTITENGKNKEYTLTDEAKKKFQEDYAKFVTEEFVLDILDSTKDAIEVAKKLILESEVDLDTQEKKIVYDEVCLVFETCEELSVPKATA